MTPEELSTFLSKQRSSKARTVKHLDETSCAYRGYLIGKCRIKSQNTTLYTVKIFGFVHPFDKLGQVKAFLDKHIADCYDVKVIEFYGALRRGQSGH